MKRFFIAVIAMVVTSSASTCMAWNLLANKFGEKSAKEMKIKNNKKQKNSGLVSGSYVDAGADSDSEQNEQRLFPSEQFEKMKDPIQRNYVAGDMSLMDMGWSLLDDKRTVQCKFDKIGNLVIETKNDDVTAIIATETELLPGEQTLLRLDYTMANHNDKSRVGVVINYEDDDNFDAVLFDKKTFYVVNCKSGKMFIKKTAKLSYPESPVVLSFNNGKIEVMLLDKKYDNFIEAWTLNGELKNEYIGIFVSGKNKVTVNGIFTAQQIKSDDDDNQE